MIGCCRTGNSTVWWSVSAIFKSAFFKGSPAWRLVGNESGGLVRIYTMSRAACLIKFSVVTLGKGIEAVKIVNVLTTLVIRVLGK